MNENPRSVLTGTAALWVGAAVALLLTIPGLITAPVLGVLGVLLWLRLMELTRNRNVGLVIDGAK
jgi:hypothetical protein